jgi:hypothetical protein
MDHSGLCKSGSCYWNYFFEALGVLLIFIATCLTIASHSGLGIAMLFVVGLALCIHKCAKGMSCYSHANCNCPCHQNSMSDDMTIAKEKIIKNKPIL